MNNTLSGIRGLLFIMLVFAMGWAIGLMSAQPASAAGTDIDFVLSCEPRSVGVEISNTNPIDIEYKVTGIIANRWTPRVFRTRTKIVTIPSGGVETVNFFPNDSEAQVGIRVWRTDTDKKLFDDSRVALECPII